MATSPCHNEGYVHDCGHIAMTSVQNEGYVDDYGHIAMPARSKRASDPSIDDVESSVATEEVGEVDLRAASAFARSVSAASFACISAPSAWAVPDRRARLGIGESGRSKCKEYYPKNDPMGSKFSDTITQAFKIFSLSICCVGRN